MLLCVPIDALCLCALCVLPRLVPSVVSVSVAPWAELSLNGERCGER